jgi:nucleoside-diphosphate-sugar epimerase
MAGTHRILVTGATGKVGEAFLPAFLADARFEKWRVRALCHQRGLEAGPRLEVVKGSISDRAVVEHALDGVTHVLHLATCKETPDAVMDVAIKGMFWLLEACRTSATLEQFVLIGGDAAVGHAAYPRSIPITESEGHRAYPGCYALSKVLEEVMLEQYFMQYDLNGCCLRAPWIMAKDDFRYQLSFGEDVFGAPRWRDLVGSERADRYQKQGAIPVMQDPHGVPVKRNFVHVDDLVECILLALDNPKATQQLFNVCMDEPVDYGELGAYLAETRGLPSVPIKTDNYSVWLDNTKVKLVLNFRPKYDLRRLTDSAFDYRRAADDPRKIWYPG